MTARSMKTWLPRTKSATRKKKKGLQEQLRKRMQARRESQRPRMTVKIF